MFSTSALFDVRDLTFYEKDFYNDQHLSRFQPSVIKLKLKSWLTLTARRTTKFDQFQAAIKMFQIEFQSVNKPISISVAVAE